MYAALRIAVSMASGQRVKKPLGRGLHSLCKLLAACVTGKIMAAGPVVVALAAVVGCWSEMPALFARSSFASVVVSSTSQCNDNWSGSHNLTSNTGSQKLAESMQSPT